MSQPKKALNTKDMAVIAVKNKHKIEAAEKKFRSKLQKQWAFQGNLLLEREETLRDFTAYQECPRCQKFSFAYINIIISDLNIERQCGNCGHIWLQRR